MTTLAPTTPEELLRALAGPRATFREHQREAIEDLVVDRRRVLCVQRTGWARAPSTSSPPQCCARPARGRHC